jgi:hypothetical protein
VYPIFLRACKYKIVHSYRKKGCTMCNIPYTCLRTAFELVYYFFPFLQWVVLVVLYPQLSCVSLLVPPPVFSYSALFLILSVIYLNLIHNSVADPECLSRIRLFFIPDPNFFHAVSRFYIKEFKSFNPKNGF